MRAFDPVNLSSGLTLKNAFVRAAAFGGADLEQLSRVHGEVARGGVAMTTIAYASVSRDGCTFANQLVLDEAENPGVRRLLASLVDRVHVAGAAVGISVPLFVESPIHPLAFHPPFC